MNTAKKLALCLLPLLPLAVTPACIEVAPPSFVKTINTDWTTMPLKAGVTPEQAWINALDIIMGNYDMEMINKDAAYARSAWTYAANRSGVFQGPYRTRVIFRLSPNKDALLLKVEAQSGGEGQWISGYDVDILNNIKQDITAIIGR